MFVNYTFDYYRADDFESLPSGIFNTNFNNINYLRYRIFDPQEQPTNRSFYYTPEQDTPEYYNYESLP